MLFFPLFAFEGIPFSKFKPFCAPFVLEWKFLGPRPKPALLFSLQKSKQKASTPGSHKIYFYPGILQLPTVGQVKCLYTPLKINFISGFKGVRLTATTRQTANNNRGKQQNGNGKNISGTYFSTQNSAGVVLNTIPRVNIKTFIL